MIAKVQGRIGLRARAMYRYFPASSEANTLEVTCLDGGEACFSFPRQVAGERLCLSDFVHPRTAAKAADSVGMFITTAGEGVRAKAEELKSAGEYLLCHALQALAVETAEAAAEWLHAKIRARVGVPRSARDDDVGPLPGALPRQALQLRIPGLPGARRPGDALPSAAGAKIGVELTEGFMMDPEASVSAVVLHHPQARYFAT